jgi:hypothetical protein
MRGNDLTSWLLKRRPYQADIACRATAELPRCVTDAN